MGLYYFVRLRFNFDRRKREEVCKMSLNVISYTILTEIIPFELKLQSSLHERQSLLHERQSLLHER